MSGINLASCFGFLSQKQRNLCSTPWLSRWTNVKVSMSPNPNLWGHLLSTVQTQNLSHPFWQAGAENMISNHDRGQNRKDFSGDSSDGTFPSDLYSANDPPRCFDLNSSLNNCIHACIACIHSLDFPVLFFHPQMWLYLRGQKLWMSFHNTSLDLWVEKQLCTQGHGGHEISAPAKLVPSWHPKAQDWICWLWLVDLFSSGEDCWNWKTKALPH